MVVVVVEVLVWDAVMIGMVVVVDVLAIDVVEIVVVGVIEIVLKYDTLQRCPPLTWLLACPWTRWLVECLEFCPR